MCMAVIGLIGSVVSGIGGAMQAKQQQANHQAQAALQRRQAAVETEAASYKAKRTQDQVDRVLGKQRAQIAGSGLALTGGQADIVADSAAEGALDIAAIRWNSNVASENLRYQSKISDANAKSAGRAAPIAFLTPVLGGIAKFGESFG